jgi:hypothetical protein
LFFFLICFGSVLGCVAQQSASIVGTVSDQTGAVVTGATVTITSAAGAKQTASSGAQGEYAIKGLAAGAYKFTVNASGFKVFQSENLALAAGQDLNLDVSLEPAGESTNVTVEEHKVAEVETETAEVSGTITQKELVTLGLNGRNFTQLITLTPGVSNQTGQDEAKVGVQGSGKYSVNGGRVEYNTFDLDGSDILNPNITASRGEAAPLIVYPSLDALSEVKVLTSNYSAMYGRAASGTVLATTKSGGKDFHGNLYEFVRNEVFNARNYFDAPGETPLYRRNDFGGTLGGPLYIPKLYSREKSKTFFFLSEEFLYAKSPPDFPQSFNQAVPSAAERAGIFNDVCPTSGPVATTGGFLFKKSAYPDCPETQSPPTLNGQATGYPGNIVPVTSFATAILNTGLIPQANSTTGCNSTIGSCYVASVSTPTYWHQNLFRVDQEITHNVKLMFRFVNDSWNTTTVIPQWQPLTITNSFPTVENTFTGPGVNAVTQLSWAISPSMLNNLSFSYTSEHIALADVPGPGVASLARPSILDAPCTTPDPATGYTTCPMGVLFNNGFGGKIPAIVIGGNNAAYGGSGFNVDTSYMPWNYTNPTYQLSDGLSKALGKHTLQFGAQAFLGQLNELSGATGANTGDIQGILTYSNINSEYTTGNAFADFLIGPTNSQGHTQDRSGIQSFQQDSTQLKYYNRYTIVEPYAHDDWKVTPRLTLNLGLRISLFGLWHEKYNNAYNWSPQAYSQALASQVLVNPQTGNLVNSSNPTQNIPLNLNNLDPRITNGLVRCGVNGVPSGCMKGHLFNPAPRIGFAWDPTGSGTTSIRAGYGIFFEHGTSYEANTGSLIGSAPLVLTMTQNQPFTLDCINGGRGQTDCPPPGAFPLNVVEIPNKVQWPYVQQWSLSVERQLSNAFVGTIAYVGNKGTHLSTELQANQLIPLAASQNPFGPSQPITFDTCNSYSGTSFQVGNTTIVNTQPAFINLLAACYGAAGTKVQINPNSLRQYAPGLGQIYSIQNTADSTYNALQATIRSTRGPVSLILSYTYSHSLDDSSDRADSNFVNSFDLAANKASSDFDERHLLSIGYVVQEPFLLIGRFYKSIFYQGPCPNCQYQPEPDVAPVSATSRGSAGPHPPQNSADEEAPQRKSTSHNQTQSTSSFASGLLHELFSAWEFSGVTTFQSGTPFSVINGGSASGVSVLDNAGVANGLGAGSYPDIVGNPYGSPPTGASNSQSFGPALGNAAAFAAPQGLTFGDAGRNALNNPSRLNFDMSLLKNFRVFGERSLQLRVEAFNVFNHTQFEIYDSIRGNTGSNTISCYGGASADYSAAGGGGTNCLTGSSFLHPVDAHRPRTLQLGAKFTF